jgi:hypothetical protein
MEFLAHALATGELPATALMLPIDLEGTDRQNYADARH